MFASSHFSCLCHQACTGVCTRETMGAVRSASHPARRTCRFHGLFLAWLCSSWCQFPSHGCVTAGDGADAEGAGDVGAICTGRVCFGPHRCDPPARHITPNCPWLVSPSLLWEIPLPPSGKSCFGRAVLITLIKSGH